MKRQKIIDLLITAAIWIIVTAPIHEFCHYQVGVWLGGDGFYNTFPDLLTGLCHWSVCPDPAWPMYLAGGLGTGLVMWLLAWRAIKTPTLWDEPKVFVLSILGSAQIGYGLGEMSRAFSATADYWYITSTALAILLVIPTLWWRIPKIYDYFVDSEA